jgi:hypothetical protein
MCRWTMSAHAVGGITVRAVPLLRANQTRPADTVRENGVRFTYYVSVDHQQRRCSKASKACGYGCGYRVRPHPSLLRAYQCKATTRVLD